MPGGVLSCFSVQLHALNGLMYAGNIAQGDSIEWWVGDSEWPNGSSYAMGYADSVFYFPTWNDFYTVEAINSYGCSAFSPSFYVDGTLGTADPDSSPFRMWMAEGQLLANVNVLHATWFDIAGRRLAHSGPPFMRPAGPGPFIVWTQDDQGRTHRMRLP